MDLEMDKRSFTPPEAGQGGEKGEDRREMREKG